MNTNKPSVPISALIPMRSASRYLPKIMKSIEENLSPDDQIVAVDDDDDLYQTRILKEWTKRDHRVTLVKGKKNGLVDALNLGLTEAKHDWIARFDADDNYSSQRIARQRTLLGGNTVAVFSDYSFQSPNGLYFGSIPSAIDPVPMAVSLVSSQRTAHPSVVFRKDAAHSVGGYRRNDKYVEDISLWLRLAKVGQLASVPEKLLNYRIHRGSITGSHSQEMRKNSESIIRSVGIEISHSSELINNFGEYAAFYETFSHSKIRTFLALRELKILSRYGQVSPKDETALAHLLNSHAHRIDSVFSLIRLGPGVVARKLSRML